MASFTPHKRGRPDLDGQDQAAIYQGRAAHLRTLADAEADPILREQLRDLARQYDEITGSAVLRRETLGTMRREFARHRTAKQQAADKSGVPRG